jgi:quinol monooxygenase YgiN
VVEAVWTAKEGSAGVVLEALREVAPLSRREPGCQLYVAYQNPVENQTAAYFQTL